MQAVESGDKVVVGVNRFRDEGDLTIGILRVDQELEEAQRRSLAAVRAGREQSVVDRCLDRLRAAAAVGGSLMPIVIEAVTSLATVGEIAGALTEVFGTYQEHASR
jgi:methylmalonyl-CoA mutase N-terminal domain/subunit